MRDVVHQASAAVDLHTRYWEFMRTDRHRRVVNGFLRTYEKFSALVDQATVPDREFLVQVFVEREAHVWGNAATVLLDDDPHHLISEMFESMPEAPLMPESLPLDAGIVMRPDLQPIFRYASPADLFTDKSADLEAKFPGIYDVRAIAWEVSRDINGPDGRVGGVDVWLYFDADLMVDSIGATDDDPKPSEYGPEDLSFYSAMRKVRLLLCDLVPWTFGTEWRGDQQSWDERHTTHEFLTDDDGVLLVDPHVAAMRRFLLAMWEFMASELIVTDPLKLPRAVNRRVVASGRMADVPEDGVVRIAHLRRAKFLGDRPDSEADEERDAPLWSHRWYVRPHWRRLSNGRVVPVRGHVKGPEGRPLVLKNDVVAVDR